MMPSSSCIHHHRPNKPHTSTAAAAAAGRATRISSQYLTRHQLESTRYSAYLRRRAAVSLLTSSRCANPSHHHHRRHQRALAWSLAVFTNYLHVQRSESSLPGSEQTDIHCRLKVRFDCPQPCCRLAARWTLPVIQRPNA